MFNRARDSKLADLKHELSTAAAELNIQNSELEREGKIISKLQKEIKLLQDKGCETDVVDIDHEDGIMVISIVSPHLHGGVEELLKVDNLIDESVRYSNVGELFKIQLTYRFKVIEHAEPEKLEDLPT